MGKILCIETSTEVCSVVLSEQGRVIDQLEDASGMNHSKKLTQYVVDILKKNELKASDLSAIAVSKGPGSYTGLRIGVSAAKGICFAVNIPLIAISPLHSMADHVLGSAKGLGICINHETQLVPMIDARRMEVYRAIYNSKGERTTKTDAVIVDESTFAQQLEFGQVVFFGNGAEKCKEVIQHPNAVFVDGITTSARHMTALAHSMFEKGEFVDVAYFEPFYLKDFIATTSKKNLLNF